MAKAKRAKKSKKSKGRKKPRSAAQKAATKRMLAANKKCAPKKGRKAKRKSSRKGGRKARRSPAQKAATKRMLAANKKSHPKKGRAKKGRKTARKTARKGKRRAAAKHDGVLHTRVSHLEKVQNADHKLVVKHEKKFSTLENTERKMHQILGAKALSAKSAKAPAKMADARRRGKKFIVI